MTFAWSEYLTLAERLAADTSDEASLRSAISRAYYAVFCTARQLLPPGQQRPPPGRSSHEWVWAQYANPTNDEARRYVGANGVNLKRNRQKADYEARIARLGDVVTESIATAQELLTALDALE